MTFTEEIILILNHAYPVQFSFSNTSNQILPLLTFFYQNRPEKFINSTFNSDLILFCNIYQHLFFPLFSQHFFKWFLILYNLIHNYISVNIFKAENQTRLVLVFWWKGWSNFTDKMFVYNLLNWKIIIYVKKYL